MAVTFQYAMGEIAVSQQFNGASEVLFQPFGGNFCIGVIIQCFVDTGYCLHVLQDSADIVAYQDNRPFFLPRHQAQELRIPVPSLREKASGQAPDRHQAGLRPRRPSFLPHQPQSLHAGHFFHHASQAVAGL